MIPTNRRLPFSLLLLRLGVAIVMLAWSIDKLLRPEHAAGVFGAFYGMPGLGETVFYVIGTLQLLVVLAFLAGAWRTWTYGAVLAMHAVSTLSSFRQYLAPFEGPNLLFFAAWPMLAACIALFLLRDRDTLWAVGQ
jgi:putative oxidoreductase